MPLVTMRQILDHAAENNYGVPAFNINDMEQIIAVLQAAKKVNAPVILQTSTGARKFAGDPMIRHMVAAGIEMFPELPICLHQDHGSSVNICQSAIVNGYSSVMMDGSLEADGKTPSSFEYNARVTKEVVARAHAVGASVEGELGVIGSLETGKGDKEDGHGAEGVIDKKRLVTDPDEAKNLLKKLMLTLWQLLSELLTVLTNLPASRPVIFWPLTLLKKFIRFCPIRTWLCMVLPRFPRNCRI